MASRILRRSGVALYNVATLINWQPDVCYHIGVGVRCEEVDVMKLAWPKLWFIGFEPHPEICKAAATAYPGPLREMAISDFVGRTTLYAKTLHKDGSSLFPHDEKHENNTYPEFDVEVTTLDAMFHEGPIKPFEHALLWIDAEGSELQVLRGADQFLAGVDVINIELTANPPSRGWSDPVEVHDWLIEHGFWLLHLHTQRGAGGQNDAIYVREHLFRPERSCFPPETKRWRKRNA